MSRVHLDNTNTYDDLHLCCGGKPIGLAVWLPGSAVTTLYSAGVE
jgi:hypothetical protein